MTTLTVLQEVRKTYYVHDLRGINTIGENREPGSATEQHGSL